MDLRELLPTLRSMPVFLGLSAEGLARVMTAAVRETVERGTYLMRADDRADRFFLILDGRVEIRDRDGTPIAGLESGQVVGEMGLFSSDTTRVAHAVVTRDADLIKFDYARLHRLFEKDAGVAARFKANLRGLADNRARRQAQARLAASSEDVPAEPAAFSMPEIGTRNGQQLDAKARTPAQAPLVPLQIKMALARCPLFAGFPGEALDRLLAIGEPLRLESYEILIQEGKEADCMYVVALGRLGIMPMGGFSDEVVAQVCAGSCVGELPLAFQVPRRANSVVTLTPVSLVRFGYTALLEVVNSYPDSRTCFEANLVLMATDRI